MSESGGVTGKGVSEWRRWLQSAPVAAFFLLTFSFSWGVWWLVGSLVSGASWRWRIAVHTVGLCGPTVAALVLSGLLYGRQGIGNLLKRIVRWRVGFGGTCSPSFRPSSSASRPSECIPWPEV